MKEIISNNYTTLLKDIKERILQAQYEALKAVNKELISLYWDIGKKIVSQQDKESWGKSVVEKLANDLQKEFLGIDSFVIGCFITGRCSASGGLFECRPYRA